METKAPQNTNHIPNPLPPIAQIASNMTEAVIQEVMREELKDEVKKLLTQHNMIGQDGFLRAVVTKNIVYAYLAIPQKPVASSIPPPLKEDPLFKVAKKEENKVVEKKGVNPPVIEKDPINPTDQ